MSVSHHMLRLYCYDLKKSFIYLKVQANEQAGSLLRCLQQPGAGPGPKARRFTPVPHIDAGTQAPRPSFVAFPHH